VLSLPSTAVGEGAGGVPAGDEPAGDGDEVGWPGEAVGGAVPDTGAVCVGETDGEADGEDAATGDAETNGDDEIATALGDAVADALAPGVALASPGRGPSALSRGWAASTVAPSATSASSAAIGTMPIRLPSGRSSKQFGQKPDTGVAS
jgi:hypothetical protein